MPFSVSKRVLHYCAVLENCEGERGLVGRGEKEGQNEKKKVTDVRIKSGKGWKGRACKKKKKKQARTLETLKILLGGGDCSSVRQGESRG